MGSTDNQTVGKAADWREVFPASFEHRELGQDHAMDSTPCNATPFANNYLDDTQPMLDLSLRVRRGFDDPRFHVTLSASGDLYTPREAELILLGYTHVLRAVQQDPSVRRTSLLLFDATQGLRDLDLGKGQTTISYWPYTSTLLHKIDDVAVNNPSGVALKDSAMNEITYNELMSRVYTISGYLIRHELRRGDRVAVYCEPSIDAACALLAITRIGCIYVPLDIRNPPQRIESIIRDCDPRAVIYHDLTAHLASTVDDHYTQLLNVTAMLATTATWVTTAVESRPEDPAFVLYTSGSTGTPKGVILTHENFLGQVAAFQAKYGLGQERVLQQSSLGFDTSLLQTSVALTTGGTLVIARQEIRGDPEELSQLMFNECITFTLGVPSEYFMLLRHSTALLKKCGDWKFAVCGGERMTESLIKGFRELSENGPTLINVYGPTEVALAASSCVVPYMQPEPMLQNDGSIVGSPYSNYSIYILDDQLRPVPQGFPGEIFVGGIGVARGYLGNAKLSGARFLHNPFADDDYIQKGWTRMYKTGDKGHLLKDGSLSFMGRIDGDSQVKLRGIRIELEEIASVIISAAKGAVHQAAVIVKGLERHEHMVGFVTFPPSEQPQNTSSYFRRLLEKLPLPTYMRPAVLIPMDRLPTNINGKLDRKRLSEISVADISYFHTHCGTLGMIEKKLSEIWIDVLGLHTGDGHAFHISPESDFFQVGGNSLLLIEIKKRIYEAFAVSIRLPDLFSASVLRKMAAKIDQDTDAARPTMIDWAAEIQDCLVRAKRSVEIPSDSTKEVLLSGSTGFLGRHLLRRLIKDRDVGKVHAIAVRDHHLRNKSRHQGHMLTSIASPKLRIWHGDLRNSNLGLSDPELAELAQRVDVIIHNGADVSFLKSYQSLRASNVDATVELCRIASKRKIPFHYISSAGVLRLAESVNALGAASSMAGHHPPSDGSDGYIASKWMSEQILDRIAKDENIPVHIHRPTSITGDEAPENDVMSNLLHYSRLMSAVPIFPGATGTFDLVPVEDVAEGILKQALCDEGERHLQRAKSADETLRNVQFHIHGGKTRIPVDALSKHVKNVYGLPNLPEQVQLSDWVAQAVGLGLSESVASVLSTPEAARGHGITIPQFD